MLDGLVYQALADGSLVQPPDSMLVPFANVTHFEPDITLDMGELESVAALQEALVNMMPRKDAFYAIRVSGTFKQVRVRTIPNQDKPYRPLEEVLKKQIEFEYKDIEGTVVGFWSPDYVGKLNLPGYNLHFVSDDHTIGGHLVEAVLTGASASLDETRYFEVKLKPGGE